MKKWTLLFLTISACSSIPESGAVEACHAIFGGWRETAAKCGLTGNTPDESYCQEAYSFDDGALAACLDWMGSAACSELGNEVFQAHCGKVLYFKTW